ncbi:MAG TPA: hypothetical protein DCS74_04390 [Veillonellaceae bacterium]|nr:hypothetical protein [Veillonellaceae bacterium]
MEKIFFLYYIQFRKENTKTDAFLSYIVRNERKEEKTAYRDLKKCLHKINESVMILCGIMLKYRHQSAEYLP